MKIILADGTELNPIIVTGAKNTIHGALRDTLSFVFDGEKGLDELDSIFTESACEIITIFETKDITDAEGNSTQEEIEYIHKGYTIRFNLEKNNVISTSATVDEEAITVTRITVSMAQRTYAESKLAENTMLLNELLGGN